MLKVMNQKLEEFEKYLINRKVAIIGLGVSNIPLLKYMYEKEAKVTVFDTREVDDIPKDIFDEILKYNMKFVFGKDCLNNLKNFDIIFRSPSCMPNIKELLDAEKQGAIITSEIEMLIEMCPGIVIGITGSDRKNNNNFTYI